MQFLSDNFALKYNQNAAFGIYIFKIFQGGPWIPSQHSKRGKNSTLSSLYNSITAI
jgi:hypothetical protein